MWLTISLIFATVRGIDYINFEMNAGNEYFRKYGILAPQYFSEPSP